MGVLMFVLCRSLSSQMEKLQKLLMSSEKLSSTAKGTGMRTCSFLLGKLLVRPNVAMYCLLLGSFDND